MVFQDVTEAHAPCMVYDAMDIIGCIMTIKKGEIKPTANDPKQSAVSGAVKKPRYIQEPIM